MEKILEHGQKMSHTGQIRVVKSLQKDLRMKQKMFFTILA